MDIAGWIDEVEDGRVSGQLIADGEHYEFCVDLEDVLECQRSYIEPGAFVTFPNGFLLVQKTLWTTQDMETADAKARQWAVVFRS